MRLRVPDLGDRRDDLPLLVRHLLEQLVSGHQDLRGADAPLLDAPLAARLLRHSYRMEARELKQILWRAMADRTGEALPLSEGVRALLDERPPRAASSPKNQPATAITMRRSGAIENRV